MARSVQKIEFPPPMPKPIRVAAYARVSSGKEAMLHSLSAQVDYYSTYIRHHAGWEYVGVYADEAKTGTKDTRENFQRLIADCRAGKIDMVITKSVSRLARNTLTLLETVRELKAVDVDVYFEEQNIHSKSNDGELMLTILASYAQEESRSASENQKWRVQRSFEEGKPWNGTILGYRYMDGQYVVVPEEAVLVKEIYSYYLSGLGIHSIIKRLRENCAQTRLGGFFGKTAITKILRNDTYTGNLFLQKTFCENYLTKRMVKNDGVLPTFSVEGSHEAIIDQTTFDKVQSEMTRRAEKFAKPQPKNDYAFSKRITCANCGKSFRRKAAAKGPVWICTTYDTLGKAFCVSKAIPEAALLAVAAKVGGIGNITAITAGNDNTLTITLADGSQSVKRWQSRSRSESWTDEMRVSAGQKTRERNQKHADR